MTIKRLCRICEKVEVYDETVVICKDCSKVCFNGSMVKCSSRLTPGLPLYLFHVVFKTLKDKEVPLRVLQRFKEVFDNLIFNHRHSSLFCHLM